MLKTRQIFFMQQVLLLKRFQKDLLLEQECSPVCRIETMSVARLRKQARHRAAVPAQDVAVDAVAQGTVT
jgi:hypothetical protein